MYDGGWALVLAAIAQGIIANAFADRRTIRLQPAIPAARILRIRIEQAELACASLQPADADPDEPHRAAAHPDLIQQPSSDLRKERLIIAWSDRRLPRALSGYRGNLMRGVKTLGIRAMAYLFQRFLRSFLQATDIIPGRQSARTFPAVRLRSEAMPAGTEVFADRPEGGQEPLGLARRLEALHGVLTFARRLVRVFGAVVEIAALPMLHARHDLALGGTIAGKLVGDQHPRHGPQPREQLAEEPGRGLRVAPGGDQNVQHVPVVGAELAIHGSDLQHRWWGDCGA